MERVVVVKVAEAVAVAVKVDIMLNRREVRIMARVILMIMSMMWEDYR